MEGGRGREGGDCEYVDVDNFTENSVKMALARLAGGNALLWHWELLEVAEHGAAHGGGGGGQQGVGSRRGGCPRAVSTI